MSASSSQYPRADRAVQRRPPHPRQKKRERTPVHWGTLSLNPRSPVWGKTVTRSPSRSLSLAMALFAPSRFAKLSGRLRIRSVPHAAGDFQPLIRKKHGPPYRTGGGGAVAVRNRAIGTTRRSDSRTRMGQVVALSHPMAWITGIMRMKAASRRFPRLHANRTGEPGRRRSPVP